ncbi:MAG: hypothetical protein AAF889_11645 [Cyanobacteria bacterium P01_D01_bin.73]
MERLPRPRRLLLSQVSQDRFIASPLDNSTGVEIALAVADDNYSGSQGSILLGVG